MKGHIKNPTENIFILHLFFFFDTLNFRTVTNKVHRVNKRSSCPLKDFNNKSFRRHENCGFGILKKNYIKKIR